MRTRRVLKEGVRAVVVFVATFSVYFAGRAFVFPDVSVGAGVAAGVAVAALTFFKNMRNQPSG